MICSTPSTFTYVGFKRGFSSADKTCRRKVRLCCTAGATPEIRIITSDVDGTLLNDKQELTPGVERAVRMAKAAGVQFCVATGKAPGCAWTERILPRLGPPAPGVYMQGLLVYDADDSLIRRQDLEPEVVQICIDFAAKYGLTACAYATSRVLTKQPNADSDRLLFYGEPTPEASDDLLAFPVQKVILMTTEERLQEVRPHAIEALSARATLTTALPGMLEVLPAGASKGVGVAALLAHMGISPAHLMALGDGENDVEMLQLAAVGVSMGNAGPHARAAASESTASNNDDGVAQAIQRFVLEPQGLSLADELN